MPRYIGPYKVVKAFPETSTYRIDLPEVLRRRRVHPTFHASLLRRHEPNDDARFPNRDAQSFYDFGEDEEKEFLVDEIVGHRWDGPKIEFLIRWAQGDATWEPYSSCKDLQALTEYLELRGVRSWRSLHRHAHSP